MRIDAIFGDRGRCYRVTVRVRVVVWTMPVVAAVAVMGMV
jgi:hypothetical protein